MGTNTLIDEDKLKELIVSAFKTYERGLWPVSMRQEAINIINASKVTYDYENYYGEGKPID